MVTLALVAIIAVMVWDIEDGSSPQEWRIQGDLVGHVTSAHDY